MAVARLNIWRVRVHRKVVNLAIGWLGWSQWKFFDFFSLQTLILNELVNKVQLFGVSTRWTNSTLWRELVRPNEPGIVWFCNSIHFNCSLPPYWAISWCFCWRLLFFTLVFLYAQQRKHNHSSTLHGFVERRVECQLSDDRLFAQHFQWMGTEKNSFFLVCVKQSAVYSVVSRKLRTMVNQIAILVNCVF